MHFNIKRMCVCERKRQNEQDYDIVRTMFVMYCNDFTQLSLVHACRYSNYSSPSACILAQTSTQRILELEKNLARLGNRRRNLRSEAGNRTQVSRGRKHARIVARE